MKGDRGDRRRGRVQEEDIREEEARGKVGRYVTAGNAGNNTFSSVLNIIYLQQILNIFLHLKINKPNYIDMMHNKMNGISLLFSRVATDLMGPLSPPWSRGHRCDVTIFDFCQDSLRLHH